MYYTVYRITNLVNDRIYIGVHKTTDLNDSYMGSGKLLKASIKKHGIENFKKEYLAIFDNPDDMFEMESELVNEEFVKSSSSYNIKEGGNGGWDFANQVLDLNPHIRTAASVIGRAGLQRKMLDPEYAKDFIAKARARMKRTNDSGKIKHNAFSGKSHSIETRKQMSSSHKGKHQGKANSQFGSMWITDRVSNKKISKDDPIPEGWMKGRVKSPLSSNS